MTNPCANCPVKEECSNIDQELSCEQVKERVKREIQDRQRGKETHPSQKG